MTENTLFWPTTGTGDGDATGYSSVEMFELFRALFTGKTANAGGVAPDYQDKLVVTGAASPVSVATGAALVYGCFYSNSSAISVEVPTPASQNRIDRIVLRVSWSTQTGRITRIAGTEGAGAPPSLVQSAGATWDVPLASTTITPAGAITITDQREFLQGLGDGGVGTIKLADGAVTTAKLADAAVAFEKLAADAVRTANIWNGVVTNSKLAAMPEATIKGRSAGGGTGAVVDLSAAEIIAILTSADGAGSGLDTDLLDGWDGLRYRLVSSSATTDDPNSTQEPVIVSSHANTPTGSGIWLIMTLFYANPTSGRSQIAIEYADTSDPRLYIRSSFSNVWSPWIQAWTTLSDGAGSGLDADLLDGQQGTYYLSASSYTAADVLAKIKTVDGANSGLDADLLDGLSSAAFAAATHNHTVLNWQNPVASQFGLTGLSVIAIKLDNGIIHIYGSGTYTSGGNLTLASDFVGVTGIAFPVMCIKTSTGAVTLARVTGSNLNFVGLGSGDAFAFNGAYRANE